jgi:hypothetical protein
MLHRSDNWQEGTFQLKGRQRFTNTKNVMVHEVVGYYSADMLPACLASMEQASKAAPRFAVFLDWGEMTGYDSACRKGMVAWSRPHIAADRVDLVHVFTKSKLVRAGVTVADMALRLFTRERKIVEIHSTKMSFEDALWKTTTGKSKAT